MKRFMVSMAIVAVLGMSVHAADRKGSSSAGRSNGSSSNGKLHPNLNNNYVQGNGSKFQTQSLHPTNTSTNYHLTHGTQKSFGFIYYGHEHNHWTYRCWFDSYGCYCYWCPCTSIWYYWCTPDGCWYPSSHCPYGKYVW